MKYKSVPSFSIEEVEEVTLLSIEEWEKARKIPTVPKYTSWWWLRSPGYTTSGAADVHYDGGIDYVGSYVDNGRGCVRPAFRIPGLSFNVGERIFVGNIVCTIIDKGYALSDSTICRHRFDEKTNNYDESEIKRFVNSDEFKKML